MTNPNETAATLAFFGITAAGVAIGVWYEWCWRVCDKRRACPHPDHLVEEFPAMGEMKKRCRECGDQWFVEREDAEL